MKIFIYFFLVILSVTDITANAGDSLYQADFVVSADGSGDFRTLSEAIVAVPDFCDRETVVFLKEGIYQEKVNIPSSKKNLRIIGRPGGRTVITWHDSARLQEKPECALALRERQLSLMLLIPLLQKTLRLRTRRNLL